MEWTQKSAIITASITKASFGNEKDASLADGMPVERSKAVLPGTSSSHTVGLQSHSWKSRTLLSWAV